MKCYACESTRNRTKYRAGRYGLCEFNDLDSCQKALQKMKANGWGPLSYLFTLLRQLKQL